MKTCTLLIIAILTTLTSMGCEPPPEDDMSDLFKSADPNTIGNSVIVSPATTAARGIAGYGPTKTVVKFQPGGTGGFRANTDTQEQDARVITASVFATPVPPGTALPGPITGIAIWATGSGQAQIAEFDIPVITDQNPFFAPPAGPKNGGTLISVVATSLEIRARSDAGLIVNNLGSPIGDITQGDAIVTASIGTGTKSGGSGGRAVKTIWLFNLAGGLAPANAAAGLIPPFATSFRVLRSNRAAALTAGPIAFGLTGAGGFFDGFYNVAAGVVCPEVLLSGQESLIQVINTDAANALDTVSVVYTLSI